jgi:hypothetical protein
VIRQLVNIDWSRVGIGRALAGVVVILGAFAFIGLAGSVAAITGIAALFTTASAGDGSFHDRLSGMAVFTLTGAAVGGLAFLSVDTMTSTALVLGGVTLLATTASAYGPLAALRGVFLTLWAVLALFLGSADTPPFAVSPAFLTGGFIVITMTGVRLALTAGDPDTRPDPDGTTGSLPPTHERPRIGDIVRGPIGWFALVRTAAVVTAVFFGFTWFPSYPLWTAVTVIVIARPSPADSALLAVERTLGTAVGAVVAIVLSHMFTGNTLLIALALLVSAFLMVAFLNANYTLFATFLTGVLVFAMELLEGDAFDAGWQRLAATGLGAAIGAAAVAAGSAVWRRSAV